MGFISWTRKNKLLSFVIYLIIFIILLIFPIPGWFILLPYIIFLIWLWISVNHQAIRIGVLKARLRKKYPIGKIVKMRYKSQERKYIRLYFEYGLLDWDIMVDAKDLNMVLGEFSDRNIWENFVDYGEMKEFLKVQIDKMKKIVAIEKKIDKMYSKYKKYVTHDAGDKPFAVYIKKGNVVIYKELNPEDYNKAVHTKIVKSYKDVKRTWIGVGYTQFAWGTGTIPDDAGLGNSVLLQLDKNKYVYIGGNIYEFRTPDDPIISYNSKIGYGNNSNPVAFGEKNAYFMLDNVYVDLNYLPKGIEDYENPYIEYYNKKLSKISHKFDINMIHKQIEW